MRRGVVLAAAAALLVLSGCGVVRGVAIGLTSPFSGAGGSGLRGAQTEIAGLRFRTRIATTTEDGRGFSATTSGARRSVEGALEAGRTQGGAYCLRRFGTSTIVWTLGPDRPVEQVAMEGRDRVALTGTCVAR